MKRHRQKYLLFVDIDRTANQFSVRVTPLCQIAGSFRICCQIPEQFLQRQKHSPFFRLVRFTRPGTLYVIIPAVLPPTRRDGKVAT